MNRPVTFLVIGLALGFFVIPLLQGLVFGGSAANAA